MKKLNFLSMLLLSAAMFWPMAVSCANNVPADQEPISKLPAAAQTVIKKYFSGKQVLLVKQEMEWVRRHYDVVFADGSKIEFDSKGEWVEIDCMMSAVPEALIPQPILAFVKKTYPGIVITQIDRDSRGYDVDLSNGLDLEFNRRYQLIDVDD